MMGSRRASISSSVMIDWSKTIERSQVSMLSRVGFSANAVSSRSPSPGKAVNTFMPMPPIVTKRATRCG